MLKLIDFKRAEHADLLRQARHHSDRREDRAAAWCLTEAGNVRRSIMEIKRTTYYSLARPVVRTYL